MSPKQVDKRQITEAIESSFNKSRVTYLDGKLFDPSMWTEHDHKVWNHFVQHATGNAVQVIALLLEERRH